MPWTELGLAQLERWGITVADAERMGMLETADAAELYADFRAIPAIALPYYQPTAEQAFITFDRGPFCRIRYLDPDHPTGFTRQKPLRYSQPRGSGLHVYFPPVMDWPQLLTDANEPLLITEGEAKAAVACLAGFPCIALGGVHSWNIGGTEELIAELLAIPWQGRGVYICFDSDAATNPAVLMAEARLVEALQIKRGALCNIVRLPPDGEHKVGLDDYLRVHGPDAFVHLLKTSTALGTLDAKVIAMNAEYAWISREGLVWDNLEKTFVRKDNFIKGHRSSSLHHIVMTKSQRSESKELSVATKWLTHPHAARYGEILFRPGGPRMVENEHGQPALNMWDGWPEPGTGDVTPFLKLTEFLFRNTAPEWQDLALKTLAYKAQNPAEKIPLAFVLISPQGSGKTMWSETIEEAFRPYSAAIRSADLSSTFRGWLEKTLICVVQEAEQIDMLRANDTLKSLISDLSQSMNEKYRPARVVNSYTMYILTANKHAVGSFSSDDRRMVVTECPSRWEIGDVAAQNAFYHEYLGAWKRNNGARHLLGYLLRYPLNGWRPPLAAPDSIEKRLAYEEGLTPVQRLAAEIRDNRGQNAILLWLSNALGWADRTITAGNQKLIQLAQQVAADVPRIPVRPFYTPSELLLMFPFLVETDMGSRWDHNTTEGQLSRALRDEGIPFLRPAESDKGFLWRGRYSQFLIISDMEQWRGKSLTQKDFETIMSAAPTFAQLKISMETRR